MKENKESVIFCLGTKLVLFLLIGHFELSWTLKELTIIGIILLVSATQWKFKNHVHIHVQKRWPRDCRWHAVHPHKEIKSMTFSSFIDIYSLQGKPSCWHSFYAKTMVVFSTISSQKSILSMKILLCNPLGHTQMPLLAHTMEQKSKTLSKPGDML